ncbi:MAG TPA: FAD-linked oxidase C-terminal domain-containing protein [Candidatus Angelobacter sp.]|nr:FAD-linked oxidase C-terminal domain-containing protein [Candidatus Angelobacter sp.]
MRQQESGKYKIGDPSLAARLTKVMRGQVLFDAFTRGRYSTDASIYQVEPIGVALPQDTSDIEAVISLAREEGFPVLPRGGGSSQAGQTVNEAVVLDTSRHLNQILNVDTQLGTATVQPGIVLDHLNQALKSSGWYFPVDVSTSAVATIGGMTGNNSAGGRSIQYGTMVHNVLEIEAVLADGSRVVFGEIPANHNAAGRAGELAAAMRALYIANAAELALRIPRVLRNVAGYNLHMMGEQPLNLAKLLVGSEGTLGFFTQIKLKLHRIPRHKVQGVCHFARFRDSMEATQHIVKLAPSAVELVDSNMLDLARAIPAFRSTIENVVKGHPQALLLVEFSGDDHAELLASLDRLEELLADLGCSGSVVRAVDTGVQASLAELRKAGLNIMMSMKGNAKPLAFIEDCAVPLKDLANYTDRLTEIFSRNGTVGTFYAHASVGCLHVRPVLNLKDAGDVKKLRAVAEEAFAAVREYKGSHSGEHGDGIVRSEFHRTMFGDQVVRAFESVKDAFDPTGLFNPGRIVHPPRMDDRQYFRYKPGYAGLPVTTSLDWSNWGGLLGAVEMCNNNGHCRKMDAGVMCPSYLATKDEKDVTRGRANSLRLALTGQLGTDALVSDGMKQVMDLCVSCKACRRECPTGVDMARMKIEFQYQWHERHGLSAREKLTASLPRYASWASRLAPLLNLRNRIPGLAALSQPWTGLSAKRKLPHWRRDIYQTPPAKNGANGEVMFFVDCFSRYFEPENARDARAVLEAAGYSVAESSVSSRPLCCGRTFLSAGMVKQAREELTRLVAVVGPAALRGVPIIGLEPSCLLTLRDELSAILKGELVDAVASKAVLFEEFLVHESRSGKLNLPLRDDGPREALLHGHCHQKAFGAVPSVVAALKLVPGLAVQQIESSCCGMAGAFGYETDHQEISLRMAERSLMPAIRSAPASTVIVADGTSCRHQIEHCTGRVAVHAARVLKAALARE